MNIVFDEYSMIVFSKCDEKAFVFNRESKRNFIYCLSSDCKIELDIGFSVFSASFSNDSKYLAVLLCDEITSNLIKLSIYDANDATLLKEIILSDYIKKQFSTITAIHFINGIVVASFVHSDATGSVLLTINIENNFQVCCSCFENGVIQSVFCNEQKIILFYAKRVDAIHQKHRIISVKYDAIDDIPKTLFDDKVLGEYPIVAESSYSSIKNSVLFFSYKKSRLPIIFSWAMKRNLFLFDIENETMIPVLKKHVSKRKFITPEQQIGDRDYFVGRSKNGELSIYSLIDCAKVASMTTEKKAHSVFYSDKTHNLIAPIKDLLSENEEMIAFKFSNSAEYAVLHTNMKTYIFQLKEI